MSSNLPDLSGQHVGEYEIGARIGVGGMGAVYEGKHPLIGKRVAVKVLLPTFSGEKELVERFLSEARAVNEIRHRGIVDIFSFGQLPDGSHYFVMEYLEGEAFDGIIKKRAPLPVGEALLWMEETLDALDAAHSSGIIHRDIKPSNIFLVNTGRGRPYVKLLDFGIAKLGAIQGDATPQTRASVILGTPDYISPEQARGKPISPQTDLYAIGCVLFELVTGERLFIGENTLQTMWMHVEDKPRRASSVRAGLPAELDQLIGWCLEKDPTKRPESAGYVRDALTQIRMQYAPTAQLTPPPTGAGSVRSVHTPPPSARDRVLASTPAPSGGRAPLGTPAPGKRSGGQTSLSGRRPGAGASADPAAHRPADVTAPGVMPLGEGPPPETKLSPITAFDGEALSGPPPRSDDADATAQELESVQVRRSPVPLVAAGLLGVAVLAAIAFFVLGSGTPEPQKAPVVAQRPPPPPTVVEPPRPVEPPPADSLDPAPPPAPTPADPPAPPVAVKPPDTEAPDTTPPDAKPPDAKPPDAKPPDAKPPEPVTVVTPTVDPKPRARGITPEQLTARLRKIEKRLAQKEAETGGRDNVVRQFIDQARKDIAQASSDGDRREAWNFLAEIEANLPR